MSEPKFTPGPWIAPKDWPWVLRSINGHSVAAISDGTLDGPFPIERIFANAHLIAAAPELYEAICEYLEWGAMTLSDRELFEQKFREVRQKAEGR